MFSDTRKDIFILLLLCFVLFFFRLGKIAFWDPDEGRYAEIPREMNELHDVVTPRLNYTKYFEKPPLLYWLTAASFKIFGETEFAGRFVPATAGMLGVFLAYFCVRAVAGKKEALFSACVLATNLTYFVLSRVLIIDMLFSLCVSGALLFFYLGIAFPEKQRTHFTLFYVFLALAVMSKGPVALVLCGGTVFLFLLVTRNLNVMMRLFLCFQGIIAFTLIVLPWFVLVARANKEFLWFFFVHEHWLRYTTDVAQRYEPPYFFAMILPLAFWPWFVYLLPAVGSAVKRMSAPHGETRRHFTLFLLVWFLFIFLFFSVSKSKLPTYILPVFIPLSVLTGASFAETAERSRRYCLFVLLSNSAFSAALVYALQHALIHEDFNVSENALVSCVKWVIGMAALSYFLTSLALVKRRSQNIFAATCFSSVLFSVSVIYLAEPLQPYYSEKRLCERLAPLLTKDDLVASFGQYLQTTSFYTKRRVVLVRTVSELEVEHTREKTKPYFLDTIMDLKDVLKERRVFLFVPQKQERDFFSFYTLDDKLYYLGRSKEMLLFSNKEAALKEPVR